MAGTVEQRIVTHECGTEMRHTIWIRSDGSEQLLAMHFPNGDSLLDRFDQLHPASFEKRWRGNILEDL